MKNEKSKMIWRERKIEKSGRHGTTHIVPEMSHLLWEADLCIEAVVTAGNGDIQ